MNRSRRIIGIAVLSSALFGCMAQQELGQSVSQPQDDQPELAPTGAVLGDDGLIAPTSPSLSIGTAPGVLNFAWVDNHNVRGTVTNTKLYQYNFRTEQELELSVDIDESNPRFSLPITPHRIAWDANSYRVEICTQDNCLSSQRVAISDLLINAVTATTPANPDLSTSFGDDIAMNATGNVAVVSSPQQASAAVLFNLEQQWIQATTLNSPNFIASGDARMKVAASASGDTIAIASITTRSNPVISVFDRLGENWIETASIAAFAPSLTGQQWHTESMSLQLSANGDRLLFGAVPALQSINDANNQLCRLVIFDRNANAWARTTQLSVPTQHTRLASTTASADISTVVALSSFNNGLYIHAYSNSGSQWSQAQTQYLDNITPTADTKLAASANATQLTLAAWELNSNNTASAVAWKLEKRSGGWVARDSIRTPPMNDTTAKLRLATDAALQSIAVGWQAQGNANLAFYEQIDSRWVHQFSVPDGLNLNSTVPLVQSLAMSSDNSTTLIGTTNTGSGGVVSSFR